MFLSHPQLLGLDVWEGVDENLFLQFSDLRVFWDKSSAQPGDGPVDDTPNNDKAGRLLNLIRWTSPRTIKEIFVPPKDYPYPLMK